MKVRRGLLVQGCAAVLFRFWMRGVRAQMPLNISRVDSK
jgi:hypothetical protein